MTAASEEARKFRALLRTAGAGGKRFGWSVFSDFLEMAYCAIAKTATADPDRRDKLEARYMDRVSQYARPEVNAICGMLALSVTTLGESGVDLLGVVYEDEGYADQKYGGQFFTPYHICRVMAELTMGDVIDGDPVITLAEPAAGSGRMVLAAAHYMREQKRDPEQHLWVDATDLSQQCAQMCYLQMACSGIPGIVRHGDSISRETFESAVTPAGVRLIASSDFLRDKLFGGGADGAPASPAPAAPPALPAPADPEPADTEPPETPAMPEPDSDDGGQLLLF